MVDKESSSPSKKFGIRPPVWVGVLFVVLAALTLIVFRLPWREGESAILSDFIPKTAHFERSGTVLLLEVATSTETRTRGLGGREKLDENTALLMIFPEDDTYGIWMKDMLFTIDVLWLDSKGRIIDIVERMAPETYPQAFMPSEEVRYVLEAPAGFITAHGVLTGDRVRFE